MSKGYRQDKSRFEASTLGSQVDGDVIRTLERHWQILKGARQSTV